MDEAEKIIRAKEDEEARNALIDEYSDYIRRCASRAAQRFVDQHDDAWSEALIGFNDAVSAYDVEKGRFSAFASTVIRNRVTDYLRSENRQGQAIPLSSLAREDDEGAGQPEIEDESSGMTEASLEIFSLQSELSSFGISFFDLPAASPKSRKTRAACMEVIRFISEDEALSRELRKSGQLPAGRLVSELGVSSKLLDRHRRYIIAGVLIMGGDYTIIQEYFKPGKEVPTQ